MKQKGLFLVSKVIGDGVLVPSDDRAKEIIAQAAAGSNEPRRVLAWVHTARYPDHHRFAFAVLRKIADSIGQPTELVLLWIKRETGRFDFVRLPDGTTERVAQSIAFESMSQEEFQDFWNDAMVVIREQVLPSAPEAVFNELREMLAGKVG